jgi:hypothetical protein
MAREKDTCSTCKDWLPADRTLDGGRILIGTCTAKKDYEAVVAATKRSVSYNDDAFVAEIKKLFKAEGSLLQIAGGDGTARAYERTAAGHYCSKWASKIQVLQPSLTASGTLH